MAHWPIWWLIVPGLIGLMGLIVVSAGIGALSRRRPFSAIGGIFSGTAFLALAAAILLLGLNIQTYSRLTWERPVATIDLHQTGERMFDATIAQAPPAPDFGQPRPADPPRTFPLKGDEWRIEARVLKWKPWATVLGLNARYRLERLAGEFADTASEQAGPPSVIDLLQPEEAGGLWQLSNRLNKAHVLDTAYGSAALMPMTDGARYEVSLTQSGLLARPANDAAAKAVGGWK
jgi:hypothetical protein